MTDFSKLKPGLDISFFRPMYPAINAHSAGAAMVGDPRGGGYADPYLYQLASNTVFNRYIPSRGMPGVSLASPALAGTFGAGACAIVHATQGPRGVLASGSTSTKINLSTALPAAVGLNQLANRGDEVGYWVRVIDNAAGGSGKTEEKRILANTTGTTPTLRLESALTFTPVTGATYEILSGRVFLLGASTLAAGIWKYYDIATNSFSANLATTNLPATISTDTCMFAMSESNVPNTRSPGEGFYGNLTATAMAAGTLTGHAAGGDSAVQANHRRNYQIRIVTDATNPTAAGQRRRISSHTAGPSPVYTLASNWTVTPSSTATYVIEQDDDKILMWGSATVNTHTYNITANTWDTTTFSAKGGASSSGTMAFGMYGIVPDADFNSRDSMIAVARGGGSATIDVLDIAGGTNGSWDNSAVLGGNVPAFVSGSCGIYDPNTNNGRYAYINFAGQRIDRLDLANRVYEPYAFLPSAQGTFAVGQRMCNYLFVDEATKMNFLTMSSSGQSNMWQLMEFV